MSKLFRGKKFLRPTMDSSDDEEDENNKEPSQSSKPRATATNANLSSSEDEDLEDDGEEEEEEESDEEEERNRKRKSQSSAGNKKKRSKATSFFDEEAEASGSEEEEEEEDDDDDDGGERDPHDVVKKHYTEEDIRREQLDEEALEIIRQQDRRRAQLGRFGGGDPNERSVAEMARDIEERHRMQRRTVDRSILDRDDDGGMETNYSAVAQQSLVPSVSDPSLWMVSCSNGKEEELIYQIMNKSSAFARQGRPLAITGAIAAQTKGKIYIESYSEPAVLEAITGIRGLMQYSMRLVPIQDMTTVMSVVPKKKPVKQGDWVRMTRGHYKGDLALVKSVRDSGLKCIIQCVPRLDLMLAELPPEEARVRRRTVRPPQKFFNAQELAAMGKHALGRQRFPGLDIFCDYYEGSYFHDGYLLKEMTVGSMVKPCTDEDPPTLDELQSFRRRQKNRGEGRYDDEDENENEGSRMAGSLLDELAELQGKASVGKSSANGGLLIGDTVEVVEGDLIGMRGKLMSLDGATVKVKPTNNTVDLGGTDEVEFLSSQVRKYIAVGAHVKVTDGRYANETGVVVAVEPLEGDTDCTAVVLTDITHKEVTVRTSQLRESAEVASGQDKLAGYELYDLVVLSGGGSVNEVGVIVRVGREDFTVINNHGIVREVRPEELRGKRNTSSNRALAMDVQNQQIRVGDTVNVTQGPHKGKTATIKRMSRTQLFLYSQTRTEHAGIFVVRSKSVVLAGARAQNRGSALDGGASPFSTPKSQTSAGPAGGRGKHDDALIGKTVRIQAGQWKGYIGTVADATATHVQVELHSRLKKVMVIRERVTVAGDKFGSVEDVGRINAVPGDNMMAPTTPFIAGGATPMHGGATPMHGGATPLHDSAMGSDEVWRPGGAIDQEPKEEPVTTAASNENDAWGANSPPSDRFGSTFTADSGWGSAANASASTWTPVPEGTPNATPKQEPYGDTIKREPKVEADTMGDAGETAVWFMERVCVQLKSDGSTAVIKDLTSDSSAVVELESDKSTRSVRVGEVSMVPPKEHDTVLVTGGADVGVEGELVCIDGGDAILKDTNEDFKIVDIAHLAKIVGDA